MHHTSGRSIWRLENRLVFCCLLSSAIIVGIGACARTPEQSQPTPAVAPTRSPQRPESALPAAVHFPTKELASRRSPQVPDGHALTSVTSLKAVAGRGMAMQTSARPGQDFDARIGETVAIAGEPLTVTFEQVVEDSRCPANAACVWAGTAVVRIGLRVADTQRGTLRLETLSDAEREGVFQKYRLRLVQLRPTPADSRRIPDEQYVATLVVRRLE